MKNKIRDDSSETMGLYSLVSLATTAKYDFATNIDVHDWWADWLTNCAECVIEDIDYRVENSTRQSRNFARVLKFSYNYVTFFAVSFAVFPNRQKLYM